jgi:hypothetical protein
MTLEERKHVLRLVGVELKRWCAAEFEAKLDALKLTQTKLNAT